jgi:hydrogenase maturation factor
VSCTRDEAQRVIEAFRSHGFADAAVIGECTAAAGGASRVVVR